MSSDASGGNQVVKDSLVLAFAGIKQRGPLSPNGRVFRRLAGNVLPFTIGKDGHIDNVLTYEEAFLIRFMRWMPEPLQKEFLEIFNQSGVDQTMAKLKAFMPKLQAHKKRRPPPWEAEKAQAA